MNWDAVNAENARTALLFGTPKICANDGHLAGVNEWVRLADGRIGYVVYATWYGGLTVKCDDVFVSVHWRESVDHWWATDKRIESRPCPYCGRPTRTRERHTDPSWWDYQCSDSCRRIGIQRHRAWIAEWNARSTAAAQTTTAAQKPIQYSMFPEFDEVRK